MVTDRATDTSRWTSPPLWKVSDTLSGTMDLVGSRILTVDPIWSVMPPRRLPQVLLGQSACIVYAIKKKIIYMRVITLSVEQNVVYSMKILWNVH